MPAAKAYAPAAEALYHSIGYADKKYTALMASVRKGAGFRYETLLMFHPKKVHAKMTALRNKLLKVFDPRRPALEADAIVSTYHSGKHLDEMPSKKTSPERWAKTTLAHSGFKASVLRNAVKGSSAAQAELASALADYKAQEGVNLTDLPKTLQQLHKTVDAFFAKLQKSAATKLKAEEKDQSAAKKMLAKIQKA